jgi:ADP-ribose pyrophosphatase YjhB (NUDIX family)
MPYHSLAGNSPCPCRSGEEALLLLRASKHNDRTWGLPGGNAEDGDADLLATAMREGTEEMGGVPPCNVTGQILTK